LRQDISQFTGSDESIAGFVKHLESFDELVCSLSASAVINRSIWGSTWWRLSQTPAEDPKTSYLKVTRGTDQGKQADTIYNRTNRLFQQDAIHPVCSRPAGIGHTRLGRSVWYTGMGINMTPLTWTSHIRLELGDLCLCGVLPQASEQLAEWFTRNLTGTSLVEEGEGLAILCRMLVVTMALKFRAVEMKIEVQMKQGEGLSGETDLRY
jgi:hypothetical protein